LGREDQILENLSSVYSITLAHGLTLTTTQYGKSQPCAYY